MPAASFATSELLARKAELNACILKTIESMRAHGMSLAEIASDLGVSRRVLLSLRNHLINEVTYDTMYVIAVGLGININISIKRLVRA